MKKHSDIMENDDGYIHNEETVKFENNFKRILNLNEQFYISLFGKNVEDMHLWKILWRIMIMK